MFPPPSISWKDRDWTWNFSVEENSKFPLGGVGKFFEIYYREQRTRVRFVVAGRANFPVVGIDARTGYLFMIVQPNLARIFRARARWEGLRGWKMPISCPQSCTVSFCGWKQMQTGSSGHSRTPLPPKRALVTVSRPVRKYSQMNTRTTARTAS